MSATPTEAPLVPLESLPVVLGASISGCFFGIMILSFCVREIAEFLKRREAARWALQAEKPQAWSDVVPEPLEKHEPPSESSLWQKLQELAPVPPRVSPELAAGLRVRVLEAGDPTIEGTYICVEDLSTATGPYRLVRESGGGPCLTWHFGCRERPEGWYFEQRYLEAATGFGPLYGVAWTDCLTLPLDTWTLPEALRSQRQWRPPGPAPAPTLEALGFSGAPPVPPLPPPASVAEAALVEVVDALSLHLREARPVKKGVQGHVVTVDREGDAKILFDCHGQPFWVSSRHFAKLKPISPSPTPPCSPPPILGLKQMLGPDSV